jgi:catechol 2,3-dioxygenase
MNAIRGRLTHVGLYVRDMDKMKQFYTTVLGLTVSDEGEGRNGTRLTFMTADPQTHHQVALVTGRPEDATFSTVNQMSFTVGSLGELRQVRDTALVSGATSMRVTSHGNAWSIYFGDPEGNIVEAYLDSPFHVPQPHGEPLDLDKPDEQILRETEAACRQDPGFMPRAEWQKMLAARLP